MRYEFIIHQKTVVCTNCDKFFATPVNQAMPDITKVSPVETDLHRVLPYGAIRASMVAICPFCHYAWWAATFSGHFALPVGIPESPNIEQPRKFAHAVFTGRQNNYHVLDRAVLALNGYWCAQECNDQPEKWLALAIQELSAALAEQNWNGNRARYHYILAELLRKQGSFAAACSEFDLVGESANLPVGLVNKQKQLAVQNQNGSVLLTDEEVEKIFFPPLELNLSSQFLNTVAAIKQAEAEEAAQAAKVASQPRPSITASVSAPNTTKTNTYAEPLSMPALPAKKQKTDVLSSWSDVQTSGR